MRLHIRFLPFLPGLLVNRTIVVGDLHIGFEEKLASKGLNFPNPYKRMASRILSAYFKNKAEKLVLLGDIKDSIGYMSKGALLELQEFMYMIKETNFSIARGNHDAHIQEILKRIGYSAEIQRELFMEDVVFLHGNSLPSKKAMESECIVEAHGHIAVEKGNVLEKVFVVSRIGKGTSAFYDSFNKRAKLVMIPPLNDLILGNPLSVSTKFHIPVFRNDIFEFENAEVYLSKRLGKVKEFI